MEQTFTIADFVALMDERVTRIDQILARLATALLRARETSDALAAFTLGR